MGTNPWPGVTEADENILFLAECLKIWFFGFSKDCPEGLSLVSHLAAAINDGPW